MSRNQFSKAVDFFFATIDGSRDGRQWTLNDNGDITATKLFFADHLHTRGFYARLRHPSYVGILLMDVGFVGVFRSALGLLLLPVVFWMFKRRMDVEEAFLLERFGDEYGTYRARTSRLVPGVY